MTDTRPFDADSMEALYQKIESAPPTDPRTLKPELSDDLAELCLSAMAKEQELRPASCRELANALDSYLSCGQIKTPRRSPKARLNRATAKVRALVPQRRADRAMLGLLGLLLALLLVLSGLAALNDPGEAPPAPPSERPRRGAR